MPAKSAKQFKFMSAAAKGAISNAAAPGKAIAKEFIKETPKKKHSLFMKK